MAKASDNQFPSVLLTEQGSAPAGPAAGDQRLFIDDSDHHLKRVDNADAVVDIEAGSGDITWAIVQAMQLCNEVMNFPAGVGIDIDLVAQNQWWDTLGTPTTAATMVDVAGEAGITETWEYALKCVADAASEGFYQRYTYADQPRVKLGRKLSAIAAVWVKTPGTTVTMSLITDNPTSVTATATAQAWTIIKAENLALDGTYVDLKFTSDTADTFYVVPLGVNIGEKAVPLRPRGLKYCHKDNPPTVKTLTGIADEATWTDIDATANTSALACGVQLYTGLWDNTAADLFCLYFRRNGSTEAISDNNMLGGKVDAVLLERRGSFGMLLDDAQVFEYYLDRAGGAGTLGWGIVAVTGFWEWE